MFPKYVMKLNRNTDQNEIKFFYNYRTLWDDIKNEWGNAENITIQNFIVPKTKHASILRYEVSHSGKIKAYILVNNESIADFPYLDQKNILKTNKAKLDTSEETKKNTLSDESDILPKKKLDQISAEEMQKYFAVTTEYFKCKPLIMEVNPTSRPSAFETCKILPKILQAHYLSKSNLKGKTWILDFIESWQGMTYFLQVKAYDAVQGKSKNKNKESATIIPRILKADEIRRQGKFHTVLSFYL